MPGQPDAAGRAGLATDNMNYRLGIIGGGRAAWAFGSTWRRMGWPVSGVALRTASKSQVPELLAADRRTAAALAGDSDLLLIAVSDRAIADVAGALPPTTAIVIHPSGALASLRDGFSLHPLRVLPPPGEPSDLKDTLLVFEGAHREIAARIAQACGARFAEISAADKPAYHAAAVFGSNYAALMLDIAAELMSKAGLPDRETRGPIAGLAASAIENWARQYPAPARFTGPAARGDREVLKQHLATLQGNEELSELYRLLAERIVATSK